MALSMEYNVTQMSAAASLGDTYSGGPIFDVMTFLHKSGWICWMGVCYVDFESINCLWFIRINLRFKIAPKEEI